MDHWRELLQRLGLRLGADLVRMETGEREEGVDPLEAALLLLKKAVRLLDPSNVPPEIIASLRTAIAELEGHIAARSR